MIGQGVGQGVTQGVGQGVGQVVGDRGAVARGRAAAVGGRRTVGGVGREVLRPVEPVAGVGGLVARPGRGPGLGPGLRSGLGRGPGVVRLLLRHGSSERRGGVPVSFPRPARVTPARAAAAGALAVVPSPG
ncbi:hypothetical protein GCM10009719_11920 [Nocardioides kribbensis]